MAELAVDKQPGRLLGWLVFVVGLALLAYGSRIGGGETPDDIAYRYSSSVAAVVQYGVMLAILLLIGRGLPRREVFAFRAPAAWPRALGLTVLALLAIYAASFLYERALSLLGNWSPTDEQGLVPSGWDSSRAGAFVAFFVVVTFLAPVVEEMTYRGLGVTLIQPWGVALAVVATGLLFGAAHGLVIAFPILAFFGIVNAVLRVRTDSLYPPIVLHAAFNGIALIAAVSGG